MRIGPGSRAAPVGAVRLLKRASLVVGELHVEAGDRVGEVVRLGRPHDGRGDGGVAEHPGQAHLGHWDATAFGDPLEGAPTVMLIPAPVTRSTLTQA